MNGGETKEHVSGWTTDTLHAHVQSMLNDRDRLWMELRREDEKRYTERLMAQKEAITITAELAKEAKSAANEWRAAMKDREATFLPQAEFRSILKEWTDWREALLKEKPIWRGVVEKRITIIETRSVTWTSALGIFFVILQLAMFWLSRK